MTRTNTRRSPGTGTITDVCDPCAGGRNHRWKLRLSTGWDPDARRYTRISRTITGTRADAERLLASIATDHHTGRTRPDRAGRTVAAALAQHLETSRRLGPRTRDEVERIARTHLAPIGEVQLAQLTPQHIDRLYRDLERKGLAPNTIRRIHSVLRAALNHAVRWDWIPTNPALRVELPAATKPATGQVDDATVKQLLARARSTDPLLATAAGLAALTGMRRGELCALRWADVDLEQAVIHVRSSVADHGARGTTVKAPKTGHARAVWLGPAAVQLLDEWRAQRNAELARLHLPALKPSAHVLSPDPTGAQLWVPSRLSKRWERHVAASGIAQRVRLHDLRHWHVSAAVAASVPVSIVAESAGHSPTTLLRIYAHAPRGDSRAVDAASAALGL